MTYRTIREESVVITKTIRGEFAVRPTNSQFAQTLRQELQANARGSFDGDAALCTTFADEGNWK